MSDSQMCSGSGMDAGPSKLKAVATICPQCGRSVAIMYGSRLEQHGFRRGRGGRKPNPKKAWR